MKLTLVFPDVNRNKSYKSKMRRYTLWINTIETFVIDQDSALDGEVEVELGDFLYVEKRFRYHNKDATFFYSVGNSFAQLINQDGKKKNVPVSIENGVLHILDDNDFKKARHIAQ